MQQLQKKCEINKNSKLVGLNPFLDDEGIIRVGGRLRNSSLEFSSKHQIVLHNNHNYTTLLIRHILEKYHHIGAQDTLAAIRELHWPLKARSTIRKITRGCMVCSRSKPREANHIMGDLPSERVIVSRTFANCGIDFCGPFLIKTDKRKNAKYLKVYISVFIGLASISQKVYIQARQTCKYIFR